MKKSYREEFLEEFKKIEAFLRAECRQDYTFRDYEEADEDPDSLRLCRSVRNYATHNPDSDSLIPVPKEMYLFLQKKRQQLEKSAKTAKEAASRVKPLTMQDTVASAAKRLQRYRIMPLVGEDGRLATVMTRDTLISLIASGSSPDTPLGKAKIPKDTADLCVPPDVRCSEIQEQLEESGTLVVADKTTGKYVGMIVQ